MNLNRGFKYWEVIVIWIVYGLTGREIDEGEYFKKGVFRSWCESLRVFIKEPLIRDIRSQGKAFDVELA